MKLLYYIRKFRAISAIERELLVRGFLLSAMIYIVTKIIPLKYYYFIIRSNPNSLQIITDKKSHISLIIKTIRRVTNLSFWKCNCLNQVLTIKALCNKVGLKSEIKFILYNNYSSAHASIVIENDLEYLKINSMACAILRTASI
jgi:hypothetical protein